MNQSWKLGRKLSLKEGYKAWEGTNKDIFKTDNEAVTDCYSSELFKKSKVYLEKATN